MTLKQFNGYKASVLRHATFIKLPFVINIFVLSNLEWPFYTDFTVPIMPKGRDARLMSC